MNRKISIIMVLAFLLSCFNITALADEDAAGALSAYAVHKIADANYKYSVNSGVGDNIAGEFSDSQKNIYSYAIFNSLDFGIERTIKSAKLAYGNQYERTGYISIISFGDYQYQEGDTVTFSGSVPTITRGDSTFTGQMLKTDYSPEYVNKWNTESSCEFDLTGEVSGTNTIMVAVKNYCQIGSVEFSQYTKTAYKEGGFKSSDADKKYSVNPIGNESDSFAGEHPYSGKADVYSYVIYNSLDFGQNTTTKYADLNYANGESRNGSICVVSFGDYEYADGDEITWNEDVPTVTRGTQTFVGKVLKLGYTPKYVGTWSQKPENVCSVKLGSLKGVNTVMVAVKDYCRIFNVGFSEQVESAYKERSVTRDADKYYSDNIWRGENIGGEPGENSFSYSVFNNLDFGTESGEKYVKLKYESEPVYNNAKLFVYDMGGYEYQNGDTVTITKENPVPVITRNGEVVATGKTLMSDLPAATSGYEYAVRNIGNLSGTHTMIAALNRYISLSTVEFMKNADKKDAYTTVLDAKNIDNKASIDRVIASDNKLSYHKFGNLDAFTTIHWHNVDFGQADSFVNVKINAGFPNDYQKQPISVLIDGVERAKFVIESTGDWTNFKDFVEPLSGTISGVHDVAIRTYATGTGNFTSISFEKPSYRFDVSETMENVTITLRNDGDSGILFDDGDNKLVSASYTGEKMKDVKISADEFYNFGLESADVSVAYDKSANAKVKAFLFSDLASIKPAVAAFEYTPKHATKAKVSAYDTIVVVDNLIDFSACGAFVNNVSSGKVKQFGKDGWVQIGNVDFGNSSAKSIKVNLKAEGSFSVYADSLSGEPIAQINADNPVVEKEYTVELASELTGVRDIFIKANDNIFCELSTVTFVK